ncbi:MAG TPA: glycosyltransferase, partial [Nitrosopumilaceae archaeon]|nr:glycosyltransferase [Nitrosopumilaceae archaeon]
MMLKFLFFISFLILLYSYIGYGILLYLLVKIKRLFSKKTSSGSDPFFEPEITLIVAAYNEEDIIEQKIKNSLDLDYPSDKLRLIFVTDGSIDATPWIISKYNQIKLLHQ